MNYRTTEARRRANAKYNNKFVLIRARVKPSFQEEVKEHVKKTGESVNSFVIRALRETMQRDKRLK